MEEEQRKGRRETEGKGREGGKQTIQHCVEGDRSHR